MNPALFMEYVFSKGFLSDHTNLLINILDFFFVSQSRENQTPKQSLSKLAALMKGENNESDLHAVSNFNR